MPKRIHPQDQWETDFQVPLPGEPRNIGPLETLFQRLLNRTERLKNRIAAILGTAWDATPPDTLAGLAGRVSTLESNQGGTTLSAHRTAPTLDHPDGSVVSAKLANGAVTTPKIADGAVTTAKIADGAVNAAKIADGTVGTTELADGAVTTPKIANNAVTTAKIADGAVTIPKMASVSADPTPNTLVLRNAQGAVQDGAVFDARTVVRANSGYLWNNANASVWVQLAKWTIQVPGSVGIFADLHIIRVTGTESISMGSRLRVRAAFTDGTHNNSHISLAHESLGLVVNAVLVQTERNVVELWGYFPSGTNRIYVEGVAGINRGSIELTPYGTVTDLVQNTAPTPVSGGLYLEWVTAEVGQTFPGPGNIVAAARNTSSGYVRYDNGIQIAWATITAGNGTWTFPAAFASNPQVLATAQDTVPRLATITSVSTTVVGILRTDLSGTTQSGTVHLYAVGLWK